MSKTKYYTYSSVNTGTAMNLVFIHSMYSCTCIIFNNHLYMNPIPKQNMEGLTLNLTKLHVHNFFFKLLCHSNLQQQHTRTSKQQKYSSNNNIGNNNNKNYSNNNIDNDDDYTTTTDKNNNSNNSDNDNTPTTTQTTTLTMTMTTQPQQLKQQQ